MSTSLAKLASFDLTDEQIELIKVAIARNATDDELGLFIQTCKRMRLDPFARQIFLVKRFDSELQRYVATTQVSIDGFRLIAERTGQYRGQTLPQWCGPDGEWRDVWLDDKKPPAAARVGVHREGFQEPLIRTALWGAYAQYAKGGALTAMWSQHGVNQLLKCAEALALRAAFPNELSGVYTLDEYPAEVAGGSSGVMNASPAPARTEQKARALVESAKGAARTIEDFMAMAPKQEPVTVAAVEPSATFEINDETGECLPVPAAEPEKPAPARVRSMPMPQPDGQCPVWTSGQHKGKQYVASPREYLKALLAGPWAKTASSRQLAWARYAIHVRTEQAHAEGRE